MVSLQSEDPQAWADLSCVLNKPLVVLCCRGPKYFLLFLTAFKFVSWLSCSWLCQLSNTPNGSFKSQFACYERLFALGIESSLISRITDYSFLTLVENDHIYFIKNNKKKNLMIENNTGFRNEVSVTNPQRTFLLGNKFLSTVASKDLLSWEYGLK